MTTKAEALAAIDAMLRRDGVPEDEITSALRWAESPTDQPPWIHPRTPAEGCRFALTVQDAIDGWDDDDIDEE